jgi:septal ring factor EnvC (AmiA/AmiB activator)
MNSGCRILLLRLALVAVAGLLAFGLVTLGQSATAGAASIGQLNSQLSHEQSRQQSLSASVDRLSQSIGSLSSQISLVQAREGAVRAELGRDRAALARIRVLLDREQRLVTVLKARLARARLVLSRQLVSSYENDQPDLMSVILESRGFTDLLERVDFLRRAESQQKSIITVTRQAKAQAATAERRLAKLEATDLQVTQAAAARARALAGMNTLLQSKQAALQRARAAQQAALAASRAKGSALQSEIAKLQAQQAAAQQAATSANVTPAPALGPSGGFVIPYAIVLCESGGQNLPPNSAGASGYYQIMPATWKLFGGTGPAAYLAPKSEQDAVAARIWNGGRGASNWVCAGIVGIH